MIPWQTLFVFALLAATFALMLWEKFSADVVAMLAFSALLAAGILTPAEAFAVFGNDAIITVACMFVLSAALERTGVIEIFGHRLNRLVGRSDGLFLLSMLPVVAFISAFVNNTAVVVVFMPILISLASSRRIPPSRLLIPLSFASILGGTCTLIGTSTNLLVSSAAVQAGQPPLRMFELGKIGWILAAAGILYLLTLGRRLLPDRETLASILLTTDQKQYLTEVMVVGDSPLAGRRLTETPLANRPAARVLEILRDGEPLLAPLNEVELKAGDRLRLTSTTASVIELQNLAGVEIASREKPGLELIGSQKAMIVESVIGPHSDLIGRSIRQMNFRRRYGVLVLAVHRKGVNLRENFIDVKLQYGDTLLVEGPESAIRELREGEDFLLLLDVPHTPRRRERQWMAVAILGAVVVLAALDVMPIAALALLGAVLAVVSRCVDAEEAYRAVEWKILFLIFGMLALGMALEKTRGADLIARVILDGFGSWGPVAVLAVVVLFASILTSFLSNNAVAVLLTPIAIQAAASLNVSARPFIIAVAIGASASFATPIGYQTNTLVYGAGGYRFRDFLKIGLPLNLLVCGLSSWLIPKWWPF